MDKLVGRIYRDEVTGAEYIIRNKHKKILWKVSAIDKITPNGCHLRSKYECPECGTYKLTTRTPEEMETDLMALNSNSIYCGRCGHKNVVEEED